MTPQFCARVSTRHTGDRRTDGSCLVSGRQLFAAAAESYHEQLVAQRASPGWQGRSLAGASPSSMELSNAAERLSLPMLVARLYIFENGMSPLLGKRVEFKLKFKQREIVG